MADVTILVKLNDLEIPIADVIAGFLKKVEMPQIPDPGWDGTGVQPDIDKFPSVRLHAADFLAGKLMKAINQGLELISQEDKQKLTRDSVITE